MHRAQSKQKTIKQEGHNSCLRAVHAQAGTVPLQNHKYGRGVLHTPLQERLIRI
jgi:hypothetical protein